MQRVFGGVAPAPLKDKRFFCFFARLLHFLRRFLLKSIVEDKHRFHEHFPSLLDKRSAATLRARSVFLRRGPGSLEILIFLQISATMFHDGFSR